MNKIGLIKLREGTPQTAWQKLEEFFIANDLFISSVPEGIVVSDTDKAKELVMRYIED